MPQPQNEQERPERRTRSARPADPALDEAARQLRARFAREAEVRDRVGPLPLPEELVEEVLRFVTALRDHGLPVERVVRALRLMLRESGFEPEDVPQGRSAESVALVERSIRRYYSRD